MTVYWKVLQDHFQMKINHFLGVQGLLFDITLTVSKVRLEMIRNTEIHDFFLQKTIRGEM